MSTLGTARCAKKVHRELVGGLTVPYRKTAHDFTAKTRLASANVKEEIHSVVYKAVL